LVATLFRLFAQHNAAGRYSIVDALPADGGRVARDDDFVLRRLGRRTLIIYVFSHCV